MLFKSQIDWMAEYNKHLQAQGECSDIGCILLDIETGHEKILKDNHTYTDGLSCVVTRLRETGFEIKKYPSVKFSRKLSWFQKIALAARFVYGELGPVSRIDWKTNKANAPYPVIKEVPYFLSKEETSILKKKARVLGVNIPTMLLYAVNNGINEHLINQKKENKWYIPFNMRGLYEGPSEISNHISNFIISIDQSDTPTSIYSKKLKQLKSGAVLVSFFFLNLGNYKLLKNMLKDKVAKDYKNPVTSERMVGSYAYLGEWPSQDQNHILPNAMVQPFGNVSLKNPICCSSMIWRGCLSFSLKFHSSIIADEAQAKQVLDTVVKTLKET